MSAKGPDAQGGLMWWGKGENIRKGGQKCRLMSNVKTGLITTFKSVEFILCAKQNLRLELFQHGNDMATPGL